MLGCSSEILRVMYFFSQKLALIGENEEENFFIY